VTGSEPDLVLRPFTKGFWQPEPVLAEAFVAQGHTLFDGSFAWPLLSLDGGALRRNIATLAAFADEHRLELAPHGKTTMAPAIFRAQLAAGAWGLTVATGNQLLAAHAAGVRRLFVANEIVDPTVLRWVADVLDREAATEIIFAVDSTAGVDLLDGVAGARPLTVVVERGYGHGRTGVRSRGDAVRLAERAVAIPGVQVVGVTGYEGGLPDAASARAFLMELLATADDLVHAAVVPPGPVLLSAGGSLYFDVVADVLGGAVAGGRPTRTLLRSGAYVTHDHGIYSRSTPYLRVPGALEPALRAWAQVSSRPEPDLALLAIGKRDVPFDEGFPSPLTVRRPDGASEVVHGWRVTRMNDQHTYIEPAPDETTSRTELSPGDLVELGISHPCTAFDKWRAIPVVDAERRVTDVIATYF